MMPTPIISKRDACIKTLRKRLKTEGDKEKRRRKSFLWRMNSTFKK